MEIDKYLKIALEMAKRSADEGNHPIGAVITDEDGNILAEAKNQVFTSLDVSAHAEITAMRIVGKQIFKRYSSKPLWIFSSLEPCFGCAFYMTYTNIQNVVWALNDPLNGAIEELKTSQRIGEKIRKKSYFPEPNKELKEASKNLMCEYFINKGDLKTAALFK